MRALLQRVTRGAVSVDDQCIGQIGSGLGVLLGVKQGDSLDEARWLARKIANLRIFEDDQGAMNLSLIDIQGAALIISQFTLYGDARKGRRPSYSHAARPEQAAPLIDQFCELLRDEGVEKIETGQFQAHMQVEIHNDGPVTLMLDTDISRRGNAKS